MINRNVFQKVSRPIIIEQVNFVIRDFLNLSNTFSLIGTNSKCMYNIFIFAINDIHNLFCKFLYISHFLNYLNYLRIV